MSTSYIASLQTPTSPTSATGTATGRVTSTTHPDPTSRYAHASAISTRLGHHCRARVSLLFPTLRRIRWLHLLVAASATVLTRVTRRNPQGRGRSRHFSGRVRQNFATSAIFAQGCDQNASPENSGLECYNLSADSGVPPGNPISSPSAPSLSLTLITDHLDELIESASALSLAVDETVADVVDHYAELSENLGASLSMQMSQIFESMWADRIATRSDDSAEISEIEKLGNCVKDDLIKLVEDNVEHVIYATIPSIEQTVDSAVHSVTAQALQNVTVEEHAMQNILSKVQEIGESVIPAVYTEQLQEILKNCFESPMSQFASKLEDLFRKIAAEFYNAWSTSQIPVSPAFVELDESLRNLLSLLAKLRDGNKEFIALLEQMLTPSDDVRQSIPPEENAYTDDSDVKLKEVLRQLIEDTHYEDAFIMAFQNKSAVIIDWLCREIDLDFLFSLAHPPLSQSTTLLLLLELSSDVATATVQKLKWMITVASILDPTDSSISGELSTAIDKVYSSLLQCQPVENDHRVSRRILLHVLQNLRRLSLANEIARMYDDSS